MPYSLTIITYDKAMALLSSEGKIAEIFMEKINSADVLMFDEFGQYLSKQPHRATVWERRLLVNTAKDKKSELSNATPVVTTFTEILKKIEIALKDNKYVNYQILKPIFNEFLKQTKHIIEEKRTHRRIKNPQIYQPYPMKVYEELTGDRLQGEYSMLEILEYHFWNDYKKFEEGISNENENEIKYLVSLMMVLLSEDVVFQYSKTKKWIDDEQFDIEAVELLPGDNVLIKNINALIDTQTVFFIDATMPNFAFNKINRTVRNIMYGDPLRTNEKLFVIQNRTLNKFDNTRWKKGGKYYQKGKGYKREVIDELIKIINDVEAGKLVIWLPNKNTAIEITYLLNGEKEGLACNTTHTNQDNKVIVDWMRSSESRGVENDRRVHVVVGNPEVPRHAYDYIAFMYPEYFDTIPEQTLKNIANKYDVTVLKIREIIGTFHIPEIAGDIEYRKETPDKIEAELIETISEELRVKFVAGDGWQGASRCKDPTAIDPSVIYTMGWDDEPVYNMIQWGYNLQRIHNRMYATDQSTLILPPRITSGDSKTVSDYMAGIEPDHIFLMSKGLDDFGLMFFYYRTFLNRPVTSEEIWLNISPNLRVGHDTENHLNGLWVAFNRCFTGTVKVTETSPGVFEYDYGESVGIDVPEKELVLKVLLSAYRINDVEVKIEGIVSNNRWDEKITTKTVKKAFRIIDEYKLLEGSSWTVTKYRKGKKMQTKLTKSHYVDMLYQ